MPDTEVRLPVERPDQPRTGRRSIVDAGGVLVGGRDGLARDHAPAATGSGRAARCPVVAVARAGPTTDIGGGAAGAGGAAARTGAGAGFTGGVGTVGTGARSVTGTTAGPSTGGSGRAGVAAGTITGQRAGGRTASVTRRSALMTGLIGTVLTMSTTYGRGAVTRPTTGDRPAYAPPTGGGGGGRLSRWIGGRPRQVRPVSRTMSGADHGGRPKPFALCRAG